MSPTAIPARITIDFRDALHPSRTWILGLDAVETDGPRVELLAFEEPFGPRQADPVGPRPTARPTALLAECTCPDGCERDHANE